MKTLGIPTREKCLLLIRQYQMLPHIVRHSELVTEVALLIARKLNESGQQLDLTLVEAGALLHDITKTMSIETRENHAETGGKLLVALGYPLVADVVRQHICLDAGSCNRAAVTEAAVVNYADKRVKHEEVVGLEERFADLRERYLEKLPDIEVRFHQVQEEARLLERKIFSVIDISPEDVDDLLSGR